MTDDEMREANENAPEPTMREQFGRTIGASVKAMRDACHLMGDESPQLKYDLALHADSLATLHDATEREWDAQHTELLATKQSAEQMRASYITEERKMRSLVQYVAEWLAEHYDGDVDGAEADGICTGFRDKLLGWCQEYDVEYPFHPNYEDARSECESVLNLLGETIEACRDAVQALEDALSAMENAESVRTVHDYLNSAEDALGSIEAFGGSRIEYIRDALPER